SGRAALARVGRAGSFFRKFLGLSGDFAIAPNMGRVRGRGKGGTLAPHRSARLALRKTGGRDGGNQSHAAPFAGSIGNCAVCAFGWRRSSLGQSALSAT